MQVKQADKEPANESFKSITPKILYFGTPVALISTLNTNGTVNLAVYDFTRISLDGEPVTRASNLTPGEDVRASFQVVDGQPQALRIRAHAAMSPVPQTH